MKRRPFLMAGAIAVVAPVAGAAAADEAVALAALRAGGAAILLRHARTEPGTGDPPGFQLDDCRTQRNLDAAGRSQARRFGERLHESGVRIDEVRSSQWCRCLDTARLAMPTHDVQPFPPLNSFFDDRRTEPQQSAAVRGYLAALGRRNALLVTHQVNISALTGEFVSMGQAVVVRPNAQGGVEVVGRLRAD